MTKIALLVLLLAVGAATAQSGNWTIVNPNYVKVGLAASFQTSSDGWGAGASGNGDVLLQHSTDGGKTFTPATLTDFSAGFPLSIDMADSKTGISGFLGFFSLGCGARTTDGNWSKIDIGRTIVCAFQSADAVANGKTFVLTGSWGTVENPDGNGIQISNDLGQTWMGYNWNQNTTARYASFISDTTGWVTGGTWPSESADVDNAFQLTQYLSVTEDKKIAATYKPRKSSDAAPGDGFVGLIAKTTNGGQSFQTLLNLTNEGIYFNDVEFVDSDNGWAVGEGVDPSSGVPSAWVYATTNGGQNWTVQMTFPLGSLTCVGMLSKTSGWVAGMNLSNDMGTAFYTSDGGNTWTMQNGLKNFYFFQLSAVSEKSAFAAGASRLGAGSIASFSG